MRRSAARVDLGLIGAALAGLVLLLLMFRDWYGIAVTASPSDGAVAVKADLAWNAWVSFAWIDLWLLAVVVVAVGAAAWSFTGRELPLRPGAVLTVLAGLGFLFVLWRLVVPPWEGADRHGAPYLALLLLAAMVAGAVLSTRAAMRRPTGRNRRPERRREET